MDSTRRVILTVAICMGLMVGYQYFFAPKVPPLSSNAPANSNVPTSTTPVADATRANNPGAVAADPAATTTAGGKRAKTLEGAVTQLNVGGGKVKFTDRGAALRHWVLDHPRYKEQREGQLRPVDLVQTTKEEGLWSLTTLFPESDFSVPEDAEFERASATDTSVVYRWASDKVRVEKAYVTDPRWPVGWMTLKVENLTNKPLKRRLEMRMYARKDPASATAGLTNPYPHLTTGLCAVNEKLERRSVDAITGASSGCSAAGCGMETGPLSRIGQVAWFGTDDRYFLNAIVPPAGQDARCDLRLRGQNLVEVSLLFGEGTLQPGQPFKQKFTIYGGPKELTQLDAVRSADGTDPKLATAVDMGWLEVLSRPMLWLLRLFHQWVGNWGIAIIFLTIVVKLLTLYWTTKSMRSMKAMQALKPEMDRMREKYGDDKMRLNQEMMALYKRHKVNPIGGCLPMLIQMPIWFALYRTLGNSVELYRSSFFGWITDLTAADPFYVLPVLLGGGMYLQQHITPQTMDPVQAKMMKYFMPAMFSVMMIWLPAGLTLYILVNTILTILHQWYMNATSPQITQIVANTPANVPQSGAKSANKNGKKKPTGGAPKGQLRSSEK